MPPMRSLRAKMAASDVRFEPAFRLAIGAAEDCARFAPRALRELWPSLLALHLFELGANQAFAALQERVLARGTEDLLAIALLIAWQALISSLWNCAYVCVAGLGLIEAAQGAPSRRAWARLTHALNQTMIETLRVWASLLRWSLLLLIPAAVAYGRLFWVPMVAAIDPVYDRGDVDALERSRELSRGRWWLSFGLAAASLAIPSLAAMAIQGSEDRLFAAPARVLAGAAAAAAAGYVVFAWTAFCFMRLAGLTRSDAIEKR